MRSSTAFLAHDDGRPGPGPSLVPGSPSALGVRAAAGPAHGMLALGLAGLCAFLNVFATQPLLPLLGGAFGVSEAAAALTVSAPAIAVALAAPFAGALADRLGRRRVMVGALFVLAAPTLLAATSGGVAALVAWRFAQGIAVAGVYAVGIAHAGSAWRGGDVGRAAAALVTGNVLGGFLGRAVSGLVAEQAGWRAAFVALGLLTLAGAELTRRWLPDVSPRGVPPPGPPVAPSQAHPPGPPPEQDAWAALRALPAQLRDPRLASTFAAGFNVLFGQVAVFTYVTFHLAAPPFRLGAAALSAIFVVYLAGAAVTPVAGGWIGRVGARLTLAAALLAAIAGCALTLAPSLGGVVAGLALCASAAFVAQSAAASHLVEVAPPRLRSVAAGAYLSCYYLGGAAGGILPAAAWHLGGWRACVALVAAVHVATLALAWRFWRRAPAPPRERAHATRPSLRRRLLARRREGRRKRAGREEGRHVEPATCHPLVAPDGPAHVQIDRGCQGIATPFQPIGTPLEPADEPHPVRWAPVLELDLRRDLGEDRRGSRQHRHGRWQRWGVGGLRLWRRPRLLGDGQRVPPLQRRYATDPGQHEHDQRHTGDHVPSWAHERAALPVRVTRQARDG